ncbi:RNA helicase [Gluconacetobacter sacchari DSM 12717]|uniref:DEAD/DEAH box helicase n=2 Tax=Gluconacetobacter sacchari TaxID=92759 RepID=A0A7W4IG35_9PROT|nr:DEAD/DEAH box helicase [Gluconacetobacter sacchari]MBB2162092.1 DEAD/DEAH box helicase [Gluconacetobacter sacchari]GBQ29302.1 RNA helicase [Gluconacetobacter sacchari DSM 12717]
MTDTLPPADTTSTDAPSFAQLGLNARILANIARAGYAMPSPIQALAIPPILAGKDVEALSRTGSGKTAAFALPLLQRLLAAPRPTTTEQEGAPGMVRTLILSPTRELASQTASAIRTCAHGCQLMIGLAIGGVPKDRQTRALRGGADILVATPGRLLDHLADRTIGLDATTCLVLDEADRMLELGFIEDIQAIAERLPTRHQTLLFSATMPPAVATLGRRLLHRPLHIAPPEATSPPPRIRQQVAFVAATRKNATLIALLKRDTPDRVMVFTRTKQASDSLARALVSAGLPAAALHGDHGQARRDRTLASFRRGTLRVLVATDVMARGIDIEDVMLVVNFDVPEQPETYIHRIGRTARAGRRGTALSLCAPEERQLLREIERQTSARITAIDPT